MPSHPSARPSPDPLPAPSPALAPQYKFGARTGSAPLLLGALKLTLGLALGSSLVPLLAAFPEALLGALLCVSGMELAGAAWRSQVHGCGGAGPSGCGVPGKEDWERTTGTGATAGTAAGQPGRGAGEERWAGPGGTESGDGQPGALGRASSPVGAASACTDPRTCALLLVTAVASMAVNNIGVGFMAGMVAAALLAARDAWLSLSR